ncbi:MAG: N-acetylmuramoyl-L-alanine amidase [Endozoicomonas sp.]
MTISIQNHQITGQLSGKNIEQDPCAGKDSGIFTSGCPDTLVIHFTAGSTMASAVNTLKDPDVEASAHLVIDRDGSVKQLVNFDRIAWHAGRCRWNGRTNLNHYSIGIELVNAGCLTRSGSQYLSWFGKRYDEDEVIEAVHRNQSTPTFWHIYTQEQIEACFEVCRTLKKNYPIEMILGHEEIAPKRKTDPGPAFPLDRLRDQILTGRSEASQQQSVAPAGTPTGPDNSNHTTATVTASQLNFRQQPHQGALMAGEPLPMGERVEVLERSGVWRKVRVHQDGWVHGDYIHQETD